MQRLADARRIRRFLQDRGGIAAVEFAVVLPFLLFLASGIFEVSRAVKASRRLNDVANSIAGILATDSNDVISYVDLHYAFDSAMLTFPDVLSDSAAKHVAWSTDISISMAGMTFTPVVPTCTTGCTYKAQVAWTGGAAARTCLSNQTSASDTSQPSITTLPADLYTPTAKSNGGGNAAPPFAVVVDVTYSWTPLIFSKFVSPIVLKRSAYITPRYVSKINYSVVPGDDGFGHLCITL